MVAEARSLSPWALFEATSEKKLAPLTHRATLGSASSNGISISGKGIRPLHGQFIHSNGVYSFWDFQDQRTQTLDPTRAIDIGPWKLWVGSFQDLFESQKSEILQSFRKILKEHSVSETLEKVRQEWFLTSILPEAVERLLKTQLRELSLSGPIETLLKEEDITDVLVEDWNCIWVERKGLVEKTDYSFTSEDAFIIYLENLLKELHKTVDESRPFLDFILPNGSRGHLIIPPLTDGRKYLSIRKLRRRHFKLEDLQNFQMFSADFERDVRESLSNHLNILISGATGSGKTTLLKALLSGIPPTERLVVLEDTPELKFERENAAFLRTRTDLRGEYGSISLRDLVRQSLRMRPDRIVVGEVRGDEAIDLLQAMNTGHRGCLGSLHANSVRDALFRLQGLIQMSEAALSEDATCDLIARNIHMIIHCGRDSQGRRKVQEYGFIRGKDQNQILLEVKK